MLQPMKSDLELNQRATQEATLFQESLSKPIGGFYRLLSVHFAWEL